MNMIIGVIIDVISRTNDESDSDEIKLLNEINRKLDEINKTDH